jgi:hypothetical protein
MAILPWTLRLLSGQRELRMIWEVRARGRRSLLVGSAHFFPYRFGDALRRHIGAAETVVLEGPLDEPAMRRVVDSGRATGHRSLYDALDAATKASLHRRLGIRTPPLVAGELYRELLFGREEDWLEEELRGLRPWLAFFGLWTRYRRLNGWVHTLDLDAARIAAELGKEVRHLETIEEQIEALNAIPLDRIVHFLAAEDWAAYGEEYVRRYLAGDLDRLIAVAQAFPTFCEAIIEQRDPVLAARMAPYLERGNAVIVIGVTHCPGVIRLLEAAGFAVALPSGRC